MLKDAGLAIFDLGVEIDPAAFDKAMKNTSWMFLLCLLYELQQWCYGVHISHYRNGRGKSSESSWLRSCCLGFRA
jgi:uncharacterized membrane protein YhdT